MWFNVFLFVAGLTALVVGAELLVRGASKLALSFGISPLVVGLTIDSDRLIAGSSSGKPPACNPRWLA